MLNINIEVKFGRENALITYSFNFITLSYNFTSYHNVIQSYKDSNSALFSGR